MSIYGFSSYIAYGEFHFADDVDVDADVSQSPRGRYITQRELILAKVSDRQTQNREMNKTEATE